MAIVSVSAGGAALLPSSSAFRGGSSSFTAGEHDFNQLVAAPTRVSMLPANQQHQRGASVIRMGNVNEGKGVFAPLVVVTRNVLGKKRFNQFRGKAIALHSQVITEFCKSIGADNKLRQGLIRLAKKNGERLGFLA